MNWYSVKQSSNDVTSQCESDTIKVKKIVLSIKRNKSKILVSVFFPLMLALIKRHCLPLSL